MEELKKDERFCHIAKDPRYWKMKKQERKVKIDKRFNAMFEDKRFKLKYSVDKRGRPVNTTSNENLKKFYELSDSDVSDDNDEETENDEIKKSKNKKESKMDKNVKNKLQLDNKTSNVKQSNKDTSKHKDNRSSKTNINTLKLKENRTTHKHNAIKETEDPESDEDGDDEEDLEEDIDESDVEENDTNKRNEILNGRSKRPINVDADQEDSDEEGSESEGSGSEQLESEGLGNEGSGSEGSDSEESSSETDNVDLARGAGNIPTSDEESSGADSDENEGVDPRIGAESSSEDSESDQDAKDEDFDHKWGELDTDAREAVEITNRLAVCNMDWDRIKAQDLLVLFNSFKSAGGVILSVKIYPSEFGKERMALEEKQGPTELVEEKLASDEEETPEGADYHREKLRKYQLQRLKYYYAVVECNSPETGNQIYTECDGIEYEASATKLDLRFIPNDMTFDDPPSSVASDMPDQATYKPSMFFTTALNQSKVALTWDETDPDRKQVLNKKFTPDELEEMDVKDYLASSGSDDDNQGAEYEGLDNDDSDSEDEAEKMSKYKALLEGLEKKDPVEDDTDAGMEITWEPGLKETTEDLVKKKSKENEGQTPWEKYLEKKKEKNIKKREAKAKGKKNESENVETIVAPAGKDDAAAFSDDELPEGVDMNDSYFTEALNEGTAGQPAATKDGKRKKYRKGKKPKDSDLNPKDQQEQAEMSLLMMDEDDGKQHFNLKDIMAVEKKTKNKKKLRKLKEKLKAAEEDTFELSVDDPRFSAVYNSHLYNIDPSAPEFKKTKAMDTIVKEKFKRKEEGNNKNTEEKPSKIPKLQEKPDNSSTLSALVKSVKSKTAQFQQNKKKK
ncbi:unnamed protein product [Owenia fusiformis]|uniref:ESF1 n=1 Tax=Owenia fusiformis TaxID=6347 RepID=A0A8J1U771_OWEFU|nr:unnamed protein product [Owenia fusiformis]